MKALKILFAVFAFLCPSLACAQVSGGTSVDPYFLIDTQGNGYNTFRQTAGLALRSSTINPAIKTAIVITGGQSLGADVTPTTYTPTNSTVVDQLNIHDGALYSVTGSLLGTSLDSLVGSPGYSNIYTRFADNIINAGKFNRVILVVTNIGSTTAADWATGVHSNRLAVAMRRLAARGIVPGMTGVTFIGIFDIGEQDLTNGTTQGAMTTALNKVFSNLTAAGFVGNIFVPLESGQGQTSNAIRSAQAAVVGGSVKAGPDFDAINGRQADGVHWADAGAASAGTALNTTISAFY